MTSPRRMPLRHRRTGGSAPNQRPMARNGISNAVRRPIAPSGQSGIGTAIGNRRRTAQYRRTFRPRRREQAFDSSGVARTPAVLLVCSSTQMREVHGRRSVEVGAANSAALGREVRGGLQKRGRSESRRRRMSICPSPSHRHRRFARAAILQAKLADARSSAFFRVSHLPPTPPYPRSPRPDRPRAPKARRRAKPEVPGYRQTHACRALELIHEPAARGLAMPRSTGLSAMGQCRMAATTPRPIAMVQTTS